MRHLSDTTRRHSLVEVICMSSRRLSIGVESSSFHAAPHMGDTFAPIGEVIESAFGDGFTGIRCLASPASSALTKDAIDRDSKPREPPRPKSFFDRCAASRVFNAAY